MKSVLATAVMWLVLAGAGTALAQAPETPKPAEPAAPKADAGDTAWMLTSSALVMVMVPGLALFYGGLVRNKNLLGTMMHSMVALGIIGLQWLLFGYCLAFGATQGGWYGWSPAFLGLQGVKPGDLFPGTSVPIYVHCMFQGMFAIITPALISGALAERIKFGPYCLFILIWSTVVYAPLAHWVWAVGPTPTPEDANKIGAVGWLGALGALDFAGGTVVHIAAGFSGLAAILALRKRIGYPEHAMHPSSMVLTLFGAGLLWFGWFGFNGGSGVGSGPLAGSAFAATQMAAAAAAVAWVLIEWAHRGKPTALGLATGIVAGLVAVTPASGFVSPLSAVAIGLIVTVICYIMVMLKPVLKYDDSLDAFGVHGIGGLVGALLTGVFASKLINEAGDNGGAELFGKQALAAGVAIGYSFVITFVLVKVIDLVWGFCLTPNEENIGLDQAAHGEAAFDFGRGLDQISETPGVEPRSALMPPDGHQRFVLVLEGVEPAEATKVWADLSHTGTGQFPQEYRDLYPHLTTVNGNRFRFRDGDPTAMGAALERLYATKLHGRKPRAQVGTI